MAAASGVRQRRVGKETPSFVVGLKIKVGSVMEIDLLEKSTQVNPLLLVPKLIPYPQVPLGLSLAVSKPKYLPTF